jgi:hypothetical protein
VLTTPNEANKTCGNAATDKNILVLEQEEWAKEFMVKISSRFSCLLEATNLGFHSKNMF